MRCWWACAAAAVCHWDRNSSGNSTHAQQRAQELPSQLTAQSNLIHPKTHSNSSFDNEIINATIKLSFYFLPRYFENILVATHKLTINEYDSLSDSLLLLTSNNCNSSNSGRSLLLLLLFPASVAVSASPLRRKSIPVMDPQSSVHSLTATAAAV